MPDHSHLTPPSFVAHALVRAASALAPTLGLPTATGCRASASPRLRVAIHSLDLRRLLTPEETEAGTIRWP